MKDLDERLDKIDHLLDEQATSIKLLRDQIDCGLRGVGHEFSVSGIVTDDDCAPTKYWFRCIWCYVSYCNIVSQLSDREKELIVVTRSSGAYLNDD